MSYIKVTNPIDKELSLQFKGEMYYIGAKETKSFPKDVVDQWVFIYGFMTAGGKDEPKVEVKMESKVEQKEDIKTKVAKKK